MSSLEGEIVEFTLLFVVSRRADIDVLIVCGIVRINMSIVDLC